MTTYNEMEKLMIDVGKYSTQINEMNTLMSQGERQYAAIQDQDELSKAETKGTSLAQQLESANQDLQRLRPLESSDHHLQSALPKQQAEISRLCGVLAEQTYGSVYSRLMKRL